VIKSKLFIMITTIWIIFLLITYFGSKAFLLSSFLQLEQRHADDRLSQVDQALTQMTDALSTFTANWSHWNELYYYMQGKKPEFVPNHLNTTAFNNAHINFISYWGNNGKPVFGTAVDTHSQSISSFPKGLEHYLTLNSQLLHRKSGAMQGYILLDRGIMLIASNMITDDKTIQPPLGVSLFGRDLNPSLLNKLKETTNVKLALLLPQHIKQSNDFTEVYKGIAHSPSGHFTRVVNYHHLQGYTVIKDINQLPIGMLQITLPRNIYHNGLETINDFLIGFICLTMAATFLILKLIHAMIERRLETVDHQMTLISLRHATHTNSRKRNGKRRKNDAGILGRKE